MSPTRTDNHLVPASQEAVRRGLSRERLVRQISTGKVPGVLIGGRYFVAKDGRGSREPSPNAPRKGGP